MSWFVGKHVIAVLAGCFFPIFCAQVFCLHGLFCIFRVLIFDPESVWQGDPLRGSSAFPLPSLASFHGMPWANSYSVSLQKVFFFPNLSSPHHHHHHSSLFLGPKSLLRCSAWISKKKASPLRFAIDYLLLLWEGNPATFSVFFRIWNWSWIPVVSGQLRWPLRVKRTASVLDKDLVQRCEKNVGTKRSQFFLWSDSCETVSRKIPTEIHACKTPTF